MQKISSLTLVLSDQCNFSCPYCPQRRGKKALTVRDITTFMDFLQPRLSEEVWLGFYGGEPLLSWPLIQRTVDHACRSFRKRFRFTLTTNGSLLKKEYILFFKKHRFDLALSYDGLAQKYRDAGSIAVVEAALKNLLRFYPKGYTIRSVFTPKTVPLLAASMKELLRQGHSRLQYALDTCVPWKKADLAILEKQLDRLTTICVRHQQKTGKTPLENLNDTDGKGIFACAAGRDRLALLPDRTVWGCYLFYDLLGHSRQNPDYTKYCFGELEGFMAGFKKGFPAVTANYAELRQDYFFSAKKELCSLCDDLERCAVCPVVAALATGTLAVIPVWTCQLKKIARRVQGKPAAAMRSPGRHEA
jgi:MoaA/NifB/PqqE/SkfB family radical SAM enzyme